MEIHAIQTIYFVNFPVGNLAKRAGVKALHNSHAGLVQVKQHCKDNLKGWEIWKITAFMHFEALAVLRSEIEAL